MMIVNMSFEERLDAFIRTGKKLQELLQAQSVRSLTGASADLFNVIETAQNQNPWFTPFLVRRSLEGISFMLTEERMNAWINNYELASFQPVLPKEVAVIMAGNIPFVGFHDMMCVLLSGHRFLGKLSSSDTLVPVKFAQLMVELEPRFESFIRFSEGIISGFDAVIATGSNNSARYFEYYFGKYPGIIRRNRNSLALLSGEETSHDLENLADDVFLYYGMGCRNVSKIFIPKGFPVPRLLDSFAGWDEIANHHKYFNNYEYQKAILLVNKIDHFDSGFLLLVNHSSLSSNLAVLHYEEYNQMDEPIEFIHSHSDQIQCVVAGTVLPRINTPVVNFGESQRPLPQDYADGVDTLHFLASL